jgi:hypothetical protein
MTPPPKAAPRKKPATKKVRLTPLDTAEVTLYVPDSGFRDVLAQDPPVNLTVSRGKRPPHFDRGTLHQMWMPTPEHSQVHIDPHDPNTLRIRSKGATIRLTIQPPEYYPIGVAFKLLEGVPDPDDLHRLGVLNFEQSRTPRDPQRLYITDHFKDKECDDRYKFSVIIQEASTGKIGIIDPDIIHEH